jgi:putative tricarboxylic transport membrane protein
VGVYSLRNSLTDCMIAAVFGVFGLILKRLNLPIVPIILGMVLGGIMEVKLRSALPRLKTPLDMIDRPISFIIFVIIVLVIAFHIRTLIKEYRAQKPDEDHDLHDTQSR